MYHSLNSLGIDVQVSNTIHWKYFPQCNNNNNKRKTKESKQQQHNNEIIYLEDTKKERFSVFLSFAFPIPIFERCSSAYFFSSNSHTHTQKLNLFLPFFFVFFHDIFRSKTNKKHAVEQTNDVTHKYLIANCFAFIRKLRVRLVCCGIWFCGVVIARICKQVSQRPGENASRSLKIKTQSLPTCIQPPISI